MINIDNDRRFLIKFDYISNFFYYLYYIDYFQFCKLIISFDDIETTIQKYY